MLFRRRCPASHPTHLLLSTTRDVSSLPSLEPKTSASNLSSSSSSTGAKALSSPSASLQAQLAALSALRQRVLVRDLEVLGLAVLAPQKNPTDTRDALDLEASRKTALPDASRVSLAGSERQARGASTIQHTLARQFASIGQDNAAWRTRGSSGDTSAARAERLQHLAQRLHRAQLGLSEAEEALWDALRLHADDPQSFEDTKDRDDAPTSTEDARLRVEDNVAEGSTDATSDSVRTGHHQDDLRAALACLLSRDRDPHRAATSTFSRAGMTPVQLCSLVAWCARQVRESAGELRAAAVAAVIVHPAHTEPRTGKPQAHEEREEELVDAAHPPAILAEYCVSQSPQPPNMPDLFTASVVLSSARELCALLQTYLSLVVNGLFVHGGFGEESDEARDGHASPLRDLSSCPSLTSSLFWSSSPSLWSSWLRDEARLTCEAVLETLEGLGSHLLPAWLAASSGVTAGAVPAQESIVDDPQRVLQALRLDDETVQLALCSQREHWPSAMRLTARLCRWNEGLGRHVRGERTDTPPSVEDGEDDADPVSEAQRLASLLPQDTALSMAYVLAQHGKRDLADVFLASLPARQHGSGDGLVALLGALATVNSGPTHISSTAGGAAADSIPLVALVRHGMLPNRTLGVAEYAALLRLVDELHHRDASASSPASHSASSSSSTAPVQGGHGAARRKAAPRKDWVLSPAQVWRHTTGYPHPLRTALCLLSFQVVVRHSLTDAMQLEDLFVVESLTRQMLRQQRRALEWQQRQHARAYAAKADGLGGATSTATETPVYPEEPPPPSPQDEDGEDAALQAWCGALPALLLPARRPAAPYTASHLIRICDAYRAIQLRLRRRGDIAKTLSGRSGAGGGGGGGFEPNTALASLVPTELLRTLQLAHGKATLHTVLATCWEAALSAVLVCQFNHHQSPLLGSSPRVGAAPRNPSAVRDETRPAAVLEALADALVERVSTLDMAALPTTDGADGTLTTPLVSTTPDESAALMARAMVPLLHAVPYLSPFTTARIVLGPVGRRMSWADSLRFVPYTPLGSPSQLLLLRRIAQDRHGREAAAAHLPDTLHWSREAIRSLSAATARGGAAPLSATLTTEQQALSVLLESQWGRALEAFEAAAPHAQITSAPHVVRLLVEADVWRDVDDATLRPLVRLAIRAVPGGDRRQDKLTASASASASATFTGDTVLSQQLTPPPPSPPPHPAAPSPPQQPVTSASTNSNNSTDAVSQLTEDVLQAALRNGLWLTGLQFHQMITEEDPTVLSRSPRAREYASLLSRGLLEKSALTRAVALLMRATRRGQWEAAVGHFLSYAQHSSRSGARAFTCPAVPPHTTDSRTWPFRAFIPAELSHIAQAVRYAFLQSDAHWREALAWFPVSASLPLPFSHETLVKSRFGALPTVEATAATTMAGSLTSSSSSAATAQVLHALSVTPSRGASSELISAATTLTTTTTATASRDLVLAARTSSKVQRPAEEVRATQQCVHDALVLLHRHGEWESAMLVYERAMESGAFPYQDTAIALATTVDGGAPWSVTLKYFEHMSQRMRPDVATTAVALQACAAGQQWAMAFRVLRQSVLTQARPAPYLVESAILTALHCGIWSRALAAAHTYRRTRNARLAHAVLSTYVATKQWDDAVQYFYECAVRGLRPLDASIELALAASEAASEEYRDTAMMVGAIASALEDVYHISGVVMEHVVLVHRHWHREHALHTHATSPTYGARHDERTETHDVLYPARTPLRLEAASELHVEYASVNDTTPRPIERTGEPDDEEERVYPLRFY